jgi:hypothetical protein
MATRRAKARNFRNDEVNEDGFAGGDEDDHDREPVTIVRPGITHDKEFVSVTAANGGWNVVYRITVNNTGTASGVYTLTDQPSDGRRCDDQQRQL